MPLIQRLLFIASFALLVTVLAGLVYQRLYRLCYTLPVYLVAVLVGDVALFVWPERFYTFGFWLAKETVYATLKVAIALEITALAYSAFPNARAAARTLILFTLLLIIGLLTIGVPHGLELPALSLDLLRRLANGTALVFCAVWGLVIFYHLPLHALHRSVLAGLVAYLLVVAAANTAVLLLGWDVRQAVNVFEGACWSLLLGYWAWRVWSPIEPASAFITRLQPWRARV